MRLDAFYGGGSNTLATVYADAERSINVFKESVQPGIAKSSKVLRGTPCVSPYVSAGDDVIRAEFYQDGRAFAVAGSLLVEVFANQTITVLGSVTDDGNPASMASNGSAGDQLLVISGGEGYILTLSTNAFAVIADADFPHGDAVMCDFMDGYFLVLVADSRQFQISALEDGTSWDPLDTAERSEGSDNIQALIRNHREIWLVGTKTTEVWYDNGDPLFPFAPIQGVFIETGTVAKWSVCRFDNTIGFINLDERGQGVCFRMNGYTPERYSTFAVEGGKYGFKTSTDLSQAISFAQQQQGHLFVWHYVPDMQTQWIFDVAENEWHERGKWNSTACAYEPYPARCAMFAFGKTLIGSTVNDTIYELSMDRFKDTIT